LSTAHPAPPGRPPPPRVGRENAGWGGLRFGYAARMAGPAGPGFPRFSGAQRAAVSGAVAAPVFAAAVVLVGYVAWPVDLPLGTTRLDRLSQALLWDGVALLPLGYGVGALAWRRFWAGQLGALAPAATPGIAFADSFVRGSGLQVLLLLVAHLGFSLVAPPRALPLIPMLAFVFACGRVALWLGGPSRPGIIAFGFATSFGPTLSVLVYTAWRTLDLYRQML
jgi:hypothetical protein